MLSSLHIGIVDRRKEAYISYFEACLFKNLSSCTVFKTLVKFEVATGMTPCSLRGIRAMSQVVGITEANQWAKGKTYRRRDSPCVGREWSGRVC